MSPVYRLQLLMLAASMILAPILLATWFTLCPQYGNPGCPSGIGALSAFRAQGPALTSTFLTVGALIPYVYPLSYLGLGLLGMKRSPRLSTLGIALGWLGSIAWGFIAEQMFVGNELAHIGNDTLAARLLLAYGSTWQTYLVATGWVIGHQVAYVCLGIAVWRTKIIPRWAAVLLVISAPIMGPISYGTGNGWLQVAGFGLVLIASIPAATRLVKSGSRADTLKRMHPM